MFKGSLVALITPMRDDGSVDEKAYAEFVDWQINEGTAAVVPVGTTGELPTLSHEEHRACDRDRHPCGEGSGAGDRGDGVQQHGGSHRLDASCQGRPGPTPP